MTINEQIIKETKCWLDSFIIKENICPFAQKVRDDDDILFQVETSTDVAILLENLIKICEKFQQSESSEIVETSNSFSTALIIIPNILSHFDDYLDVLDLANDLLRIQSYEGIYQLASFHPDYCFADTAFDAPENYTNRSPYPMFHLISEENLEKALQFYPNPEMIPERNIELCQTIGSKALKQVHENCLSQN